MLSVTVASVETEKLVTLSRRTKLEADVLIGDIAKEDFSLIALPGGMPGAERLRDSSVLTELLKQQGAHALGLDAVHFPLDVVFVC